MMSSEVESVPRHDSARIRDNTRENRDTKEEQLALSVSDNSSEEGAHSGDSCQFQNSDKSQTRDELLTRHSLTKLIRIRAGETGCDENELRDIYYNGLVLLLFGPNTIMRAYRIAIDEYHVGEAVLKDILFRGHLRARYNSYGPLIHIDITGHSRGGKDKLISRFFTFIPDGVGESYSSTSSKAPYYAMRVPIKNAQGKVTGFDENPDYYGGKGCLN
jgi:hypothetical protein